MRRRIRPRSCWVGAVGAVALLALAACGTTPSTTPLGSDVERVTVDPSGSVALPDLVAAADAMGLDLIRAAGEVTAVTSPASLQVALSMAAEGAEGRTLAELESVIGAAGRDRSDGMNALVGSLADLDGSPDVVQDKELPAVPVVHRAGRLVLDDSLRVEQPFVDALARSYDAPAQTTDLGARGAQEVLDAWVAEHTGGLVPRSAVTPGPELRLVIQDAIVLAARWEQPFLAELTRPHPFTLPSGEVVEVDMMSTGGSGQSAYAEVEGWQAVRLPYTGRRLRADVILPPPGSTPTDLAGPLLEQLRVGLGTQPARSLMLRMPVVEARSTTDLMSYLADHAPSSLAGGFGGISDEEQLFISQAAQQGVLVIDEDGTLAAAVTEIAAAGSAPLDPPLEVLVDRPYLVSISDGQTGWTLFLAHVADPRGDG